MLTHIIGCRKVCGEPDAVHTYAFRLRSLEFAETEVALKACARGRKASTRGEHLAAPLWAVEMKHPGGELQLSAPVRSARGRAESRIRSKDARIVALLVLLKRGLLLLNIRQRRKERLLRVDA